MTLTTYENLGRWFTDQKGAEPAPFWNLYGLNYGKTDQVVHRNVTITDMGESARQLETVVRWLNNPEGQRFRLVVYPPGKHNNPTASVDVQIYEKMAAPANGPQPAGIAGLPVGVGSIEQYVDQRLETERLKWELDDLKAQLNAPANTWERIAETISGVPGIDKVLQALAVGLVSKLNPAAMPAVQAAMNGTPAATTGEHEHDEDDNDPQSVFLSNIQEASNSLGTDPVTLSKKLNALIRANPELARQLMQ